MLDVEYDIRTEPLGHIDIALPPDADFDAHKMAVWLANLLRRIHRGVR